MHLSHVFSLLFHKRFALKRSELIQNKTENRCMKIWLLLALLKVSDNHHAWESRFPGRPLGDISSVHFFPTVSGADSKLAESLGILQLSPLCLRSSPPGLKRKPFLTSTLYFIRTLVSLLHWQSGFIDSHRMIGQASEGGSVPGGLSETPAAPATSPQHL